MEYYCVTCGHHLDRHHSEKADCLVSTCWCSTFVALVSRAMTEESKGDIKEG